MPNELALVNLEAPFLWLRFDVLLHLAAALDRYDLLIDALFIFGWHPF